MHKVRSSVVDETVHRVLRNSQAKVLLARVFPGTVHRGCECAGGCGGQPESIARDGYCISGCFEQSGYFLLTYPHFQPQLRTLLLRKQSTLTDMLHALGKSQASPIRPA